LRAEDFKSCPTWSDDGGLAEEARFHGLLSGAAVESKRAVGDSADTSLVTPGSLAVPRSGDIFLRTVVQVL
jgi:hypothetical protein